MQNNGSIAVSSSIALSGSTPPDNLVQFDSMNGSVVLNPTSSVSANAAVDVFANTTATLDANLTIDFLLVYGSAGINLRASVTTSNSQQYGDPVTLTSNVTLTDSTGSAINTSFSSLYSGEFNSTVDGAFALTVSTSGTWYFGGSVGAAAALSSLSVTTSIDAFFNDSSIVTTTGTQSYTGPVLLGTDSVFSSTGTGANGNITFGGTVDSTGGAFSLTTATAGTTTFSAAVGGAQPPPIFRP